MRLTLESQKLPMSSRMSGDQDPSSVLPFSGHSAPPRICLEGGEEGLCK